MLSEMRFASDRIARGTTRASAAPADISPLDLPSSASRRLLCELRRLARHDSVSICLAGPSGTGKTLYAEDAHLHSPRRNGPYVKINLAAVDAGLAGSELLGHVEGAFTGAKGRRVGGTLSANGGTLVLDEITKAAPSVQHILLQLFDRDPIRHVGSDREIALDVRLIALTSVSLEQAVRAGALIPDLYERLKTFVVEIAPLAERRMDVPVILAWAVRRHASRLDYTAPPDLEAALVAHLQQLPLTGNHRELDGLVQRLLVNAEGAPVLQLAHLPCCREAVRPSLRSRHAQYLEDRSRGLHLTFATVEDEARHYDVSVSTIHRWRKKCGEGGVA